MPPELAEARLIDGLCRRYGCLPSQLLDEDVSLLYRLNLIALATPEMEA